MNRRSRLRDYAQVAAMSPLILIGAAILLILYLPAVLFFGVPALGAVAALVLFVTTHPIQCAIVAGLVAAIRQWAQRQDKQRGQRAACEYLSVTLLRMRHYGLSIPPRAQLLDWMATIRADDSPPRYDGLTFDCKHIWTHGPFKDGFRAVIDVVSQYIDADADWSPSGSPATDLERFVIFITHNGDSLPPGGGRSASGGASVRAPFCIEQHIADLLNEREDMELEEDDKPDRFVSSGCIFCGRPVSISRDTGAIVTVK
jgi:hypothetical protein